MRNIRSTLFTLITVLVTITGCRDDASGGKTNVVIIFIDDMGYADPSCFGNVMLQTPNIDRLAEQGLKMTNFYVNSPICSPSRVALNTGCYPMRYQIHSFLAGKQQNRDRAMADFLPASVNTLARTLQGNGYVTGHFGKWHMGGGRDVGDAPLPSAYGFNESLVAFEGLGDRLLQENHGLSKRSAKLGRGEIYFAPKHLSTSIFVDSALAFIEKSGDQPFFINLCPNDIHDPHLPTPEDQAGYARLSENPFEQKFFAVLSELDCQIGRFMDELEKMGKLENTMVIFTSDNGPTDWPYYYNPGRYPEGYEGEMAAPGFTGAFYGRKWSLYEGGIRMPFIITWRGHVPEDETDSTSVVSAIDLFPSICSLLDIEVPEGLDGSNKSQAFLGIPVKDSEALMWEYASNPGGSILPGNPANISPNLAIREGDWKLLINVDSTGAELYNLVSDPGEQNNLAGEMQEKAASMASQVISWRRSMPVAIPNQ